MADTTSKLEKLRKEFSKASINGFIIPRADRFQSKYPTAHDERLKWLTGFTGSAGFAAVTKDKAVVMTDPRYAITIKKEVDQKLYEIGDYNTQSPMEWLCQNLEKGSKIGYDPFLHTVSDARSMQKICDKYEMVLTAVDQNPVDIIWDNQPAPAKEDAYIHRHEFSGRSSEDKRAEIGKSLTEDKIDLALITATDSLCWMLNIRGNDTAHSPTAQGAAIIDKNGGVTLFIDKDKISKDVLSHMGKNVSLKSLEDLEDALSTAAKSGQTISFDPNKTPQAYADILVNRSANIRESRDPCILPKACKNKTEQENLRKSHKRDSLAWVRWLHWLDTSLTGGESEMDLSDKLDEFRKLSNDFRQHGYPPIAGWAENGANIHYHSEGRGAKIGRDNLFLIDSGAQSLDGQTDITRAIPIGRPSKEMVENYTLVLKGHIRLAKAIFPKGTNGAQLDTFARAALWEKGRNYAHGTGHGIGFFLDVHEGPANIGPRSTEPLREGMLMSNEPGYYKEGHFGIRLENEVLVQPWDRNEDGESEQEMLCFETLSYIPFDRRLIDASLLDADEILWLNSYHAEIYSLFEKDLDKNQALWLKEMTAPLPLKKGPKPSPTIN